MKAMKGRVMNKLKSLPQMQLRQGHRILQLKTASAGFSRSSLPGPPGSKLLKLVEIHPETIDMAETLRGVGDEEEEGKESTELAVTPHRKRQRNDDFSHPFRRPDFDSSTLFDPNLLAAFEQAVKDYLRILDLWKQFKERGEEIDLPSEISPASCILKEFEEKCPPGGRGAVIFYSTSLRAVRKTFEGCTAIRFLLKSSRVQFYERDVSMHTGFRDELQGLLGSGAIPPRLFVDGRCIGGADEVLGLHERGKLMPLLEGMPRDLTAGAACRRCGGGRFLVCGSCNGGHKMYDKVSEFWRDCDLCNENGLVVCPLCCC